MKQVLIMFFFLVFLFSCSTGIAEFADENSTDTPRSSEEITEPDVQPCEEYRFVWNYEFGKPSSLDTLCIESCPPGYDEYRGQAGIGCIKHMREEIYSWPKCGLCEEGSCVYVSTYTDGERISWPSEEDAWRCVPQDYKDSQMSKGLRVRGPDGQEAMGIA